MPYNLIALALAFILITPGARAVPSLQPAAKALAPSVVRQIEKQTRNQCEVLGTRDGRFNNELTVGLASPGGRIGEALVAKGLELPPEFPTRIVRAPANGTLARGSNEYSGVYRGRERPFTSPDFTYTPNKGFIGTDRASFEVDVGGRMFVVNYTFRVMEQFNPEADCGR